MRDGSFDRWFQGSCFAGELGTLVFMLSVLFWFLEHLFRRVTDHVGWVNRLNCVLEKQRRQHDCLMRLEAQPGFAVLEDDTSLMHTDAKGGSLDAKVLGGHGINLLGFLAAMPNAFCLNLSIASMVAVLAASPPCGWPLAGSPPLYWAMILSRSASSFFNLVFSTLRVVNPMARPRTEACFRTISALWSGV